MDWGNDRHCTRKQGFGENDTHCLAELLSLWRDLLKCLAQRSRPYLLSDLWAFILLAAIMSKIVKLGRKIIPLTLSPSIICVIPFLQPVFCSALGDCRVVPRHSECGALVTVRTTWIEGKQEFWRAWFFESLKSLLVGGCLWSRSHSGGVLLFWQHRWRLAGCEWFRFYKRSAAILRFRSDAGYKTFAHFLAAPSSITAIHSDVAMPSPGQKIYRFQVPNFWCHRKSDTPKTGSLDVNWQIAGLQTCNTFAFAPARPEMAWFQGMKNDRTIVLGSSG